MSCYKFILSAIISLCFLSASAASFNWPKQQVDMGYDNSSYKTFTIPKPPKPFFWSSHFAVNSGGNMSYRYIYYHTKQYFSFQLGATTAMWFAQSKTLFTLSAIFELRWWILHTRYFNPYLMYSIASPTLLSREHFADSHLGGHFLFQDYLGAGMLIGNSHRFAIEVKVMHYSNGDLAVYNDGLQVPFLLSIGYVF